MRLLRLLRYINRTKHISKVINSIGPLLNLPIVKIQGNPDPVIAVSIAPHGAVGIGPHSRKSQEFFWFLTEILQAVLCNCT